MSQALWSRLAAAGLTTGEMPAATESTTPWYVRVMLCIAGLIAAIFLLVFVGVGFTAIMESAAACTVAGSVLIAAAYALFRVAPKSDFGSMFALAVSFAGQAMALFGVFVLFSDGTTGLSWTIVVIMEAALAIVVPNFIHRVVCAFGAGLASLYALLYGGLGLLAPGLLAAAVAYLWLNEARHARLHSTVAPVGYGITLAFLFVEASPFFGRQLLTMPGLTEVTPWVAPWIGNALVVAALVFTVVTIFRRAGWALTDSKSMLALAATVAIGAASFKAPGMAGGLMVALLGFANGNRVLLGLGIAGLVCYVSAYYYLLQITLLAKSGVLAATGAALIAARALLLKVMLPEARNRA